jgi:hypothetical protein
LRGNQSPAPALVLLLLLLLLLLFGLRTCGYYKQRAQCAHCGARSGPARTARALPLSWLISCCLDSPCSPCSSGSARFLATVYFPSRARSRGAISAPISMKFLWYNPQHNSQRLADPDPVEVQRPAEASSLVPCTATMHRAAFLGRSKCHFMAKNRAHCSPAPPTVTSRLCFAHLSSKTTVKKTKGGLTQT